jgi:hypothetical protein
MSYENPTGKRDHCATIAKTARVADRRLSGPVPPSFEDFYRARLRFVPGARIRTLHIADMYRAWAAQNRKPSLSLKKLKRAMSNIGHRAIESHGMFYGDVGFAADHPDLTDNFPTLAPMEAAVILERIDAAIAELGSVRRVLTDPRGNDWTAHNNERTHGQ